MASTATDVGRKGTDAWQQRSRSFSDASRSRARTALVAHHGQSLLRVARRVSLCADDAHDAVQRALEIYLRRLDTVDPRTEAAWMRGVVRNESLAVREQALAASRLR